MRDRRDRCPGADRPWPAADGLLVRLRVPGGQIPIRTLRAVAAVAEEYGDGLVHLTSRANLQVRALPSADGALRDDVRRALAATGLLPAPRHELVRNILTSPATGLAGGMADLRPLTRALDVALCADPVLADLPGRFLFVLDDGRGDLVERQCDLGLVALDDATAQLRVGQGYGPVVALADASTALAELARRFLTVRGAGTSAPWHVHELDATADLAPVTAADPRLPAPSAPLPFGPGPAGEHREVPEALMSREFLDALEGDHLVLTPWRGVLLPTPDPITTQEGSL
ncbi:nitrite reductase [Nocardioides sp.]|uniref:nitrite reductase n=1 Tax=Nocardioides sp. TaxID=35761 RepID=UPI0026065DC4|nr:nitrite reductase [Nocardioides sp.]